MAGHEFQKFVCYPLSRRSPRERRSGHQLDRRTQIQAGCRMAARRLEPAGQARRLPACIRGLALRLARRARDHQDRIGLFRVSDGRPRSAAALDTRRVSRSWAMPRIQCTRSARMARHRRSSTRGYWLARSRPRARRRPRSQAYEDGTPPGHIAHRACQSRQRARDGHATGRAARAERLCPASRTCSAAPNWKTPPPATSASPASTRSSSTAAPQLCLRRSRRRGSVSV